MPDSNTRRKKQPLRVNLPGELPELTPEVSRILLDVLLELADRKRKNPNPEHRAKPHN
jgi:hypothetical protein